MSLLPVAALIAEYNRDKPSRFDLNCNYELTDGDSQKLLKIRQEIRRIASPLVVEIRLVENCKQIYLRCTEKAVKSAPPKMEKLTLPSIYQDKKKV